MHLNVVQSHSSIKKMPILPSELDFILHQKIEAYRDKKGNSYRKLSEELYQYVRREHLYLWERVEKGVLEEDDLLKLIKSRVPSDTYIRDFCNGRPICYRYTNTLACFFDVDYTFTKFEGAKDTEMQLSLLAHIDR